MHLGDGAGRRNAPEPARIRAFRTGASGPVNLQFGPGGDLFYPDFNGGTVKRIHYSAGNQAPRAVVSATPTNGSTPLQVDFSATGSSDPDPGDTLTYEWDLDGDGAYDDATGATAQYTYSAAGRYLAGVRVTDNHDATATDAVAISAGNTPPTATIVTPSTGLTWKVGDAISFTGSATDPQDGNLDPRQPELAPDAVPLPLELPQHDGETWDGVASGSFAAPDHEYPAYLELELTATDSGGLTDTRTIRLDPKTVVLSLASNPSGLALSLNGATGTTPFKRTVIEGSENGLAAPTPQTLASQTYDFASWSDGGARVHKIKVDGDRTLTATFTKR